MASRLLYAGLNESFYGRLKAVLEDIDCDITRATSLGLALFLAHKNLPSVIVLEPLLAEGKGEDILAELMGDQELSHIPVLYHAGKNTDKASSCYHPNIKGIIEPDIDDEKLFRLLSQFLRPVEDRREKDPVD